jgi:tetratricopeptide (TPR) repeat protein
LAGSGLCLLLALAVSWYGWHGVQRQLLLMQVRNHYDMGQRARRRKHGRKARIYFDLALKSWNRARRMPGFLPVENDGFNGFLTAGNCYLMTRQFMRARECFAQAYKYDPNSITVLTSLGTCSYLLGEHERARELLEQSNRIYPLKKKLRLVLKKIQEEKKQPEEDTAGR